MTTPTTSRKGSIGYVPSESKPPKSDVQKAADSLAAASRLLRKAESNPSLAAFAERHAAAQAVAADALADEARKELASYVENARAARAFAVSFNEAHGSYIETLAAAVDSTIMASVFTKIALDGGSVVGDVARFRDTVLSLRYLGKGAISNIDRLIERIETLTGDDLKTGLASVGGLKFELSCAVACVQDLRPRLDEVQAAEKRMLALIEKNSEGR